MTIGRLGHLGWARCETCNGKIGLYKSKAGELVMRPHKDRHDYNHHTGQLEWCAGSKTEGKPL